MGTTTSYKIKDQNAFTDSRKLDGNVQNFFIVFNANYKLAFAGDL